MSDAASQAYYDSLEEKQFFELRRAEYEFSKAPSLDLANKIISLVTKFPYGYWFYQPCAKPIGFSATEAEKKVSYYQSFIKQAE